jgi:hypothetical protein
MWIGSEPRELWQAQYKVPGATPYEVFHRQLVPDIGAVGARRLKDAAGAEVNRQTVTRKRVQVRDQTDPVTFELSRVGTSRIRYACSIHTDIGDRLLE